MAHHHHGMGDAVFAIQAHVLGMFAPSFVTGTLIWRFGVLRVMVAGVLLLAGHVAIAVCGAELLHFVSAMILLGVGWNFLYLGGTTLLTETYAPEKRPGLRQRTIFWSSAWWPQPRTLPVGCYTTLAGRR